MERQPWEWRKAQGGFYHRSDLTAGERLFHAYDVNHNAACDPGLGLFRSCEPVTEGSALCPACIDVMKALPAGRDPRVEAAA